MEPDSFSTYPRDAIQCAFPRSPWRLRFVDRWLFHRLSIYLVQSLANRLGGYPSGVSVALSFLPRHRVRCLLSCGVRKRRGNKKTVTTALGRTLRGNGGQCMSNGFRFVVYDDNGLDYIHRKTCVNKLQQTPTRSMLLQDHIYFYSP
jgi:hypothetical protein